jgi:hypothetical protein
MDSDLAFITQRANDNLHQITHIEQITEDGHKGYIFTLKSGMRLHPIFPKRDIKQNKYSCSFTHASSQSIHQLLCEYYLAHNETFDDLIGNVICAKIGDRTFFKTLRRGGAKPTAPEIGFTNGYTIDLVKTFNTQLLASFDKKKGLLSFFEGENCTFTPFITKVPIYEMLYFMGKKTVAKNTIRLANKFHNILVTWTAKGTCIYQDNPSDELLSPFNIVEVFEQHFKAPRQKDYYKVDWELGESQSGFYLYPRDDPCLIMCKERQTHVSYRASTADDYDRIVHYVVTFIGFPIYRPPRDDDSSKVPVKSINTANAWCFKRW